MKPLPKPSETSQAKHRLWPHPTIELGKQFPNDTTFAALADLYAVPLVELLAEESVDRRRIDVPPGVPDDAIRAAAFDLAGLAAPSAKARDPHAFDCPHCGRRIVGAKG